MNIGVPDLAHILCALSLLLCAAHGFGYLFKRLRQPPVIGEIVGGLLLGPTVLGHFLPDLQKWIFAANPATSVLLGSIYQLGLLLLMFCSGSEMRAAFQRGDRKAVALMTLLGTVVPFGLGVGFLRFVDVASLIGTAQSRSAFVLVFAVATAVTSIPVISRIMMDLDLMETSFARVVLSIAVLEDVILYVALAIALAAAGAAQGKSFGLPVLLGVDAGNASGRFYYVIATISFFVLALLAGRELFAWLESSRYNLLRKSSPVAHLLVVLLAMTAFAILLGIPPMFGAFVAGIATGALSEEPEKARETIRSFSMAFFIPVYFAVVGFKLDLLRAFDPAFFIIFLVFACAAKASSVYLGARLAGETDPGAFNFAAAMNARGGPGIVLASLAYDAQIVNESFYATLVMLAIVTSLLAGSWLEHVVRSGRKLR